MVNLTLFTTHFLAYLILVMVFAGCALAAVFVGIALRKKKNAKDAAEDGEIAESET